MSVSVTYFVYSFGLQLTYLVFYNPDLDNRQLYCELPVGYLVFRLCLQITTIINIFDFFGNKLNKLHTLNTLQEPLRSEMFAFIEYDEQQDERRAASHVELMEKIPKLNVQELM